VQRPDTVLSGSSRDLASVPQIHNPPRNLQNIFTLKIKPWSYIFGRKNSLWQLIRKRQKSINGEKTAAKKYFIKGVFFYRRHLHSGNKFLSIRQEQVITLGFSECIDCISRQSLIIDLLHNRYIPDFILTSPGD
jgi:hypothetical protein